MTKLRGGWVEGFYLFIQNLCSNIIPFCLGNNCFVFKLKIFLYPILLFRDFGFNETVGNVSFEMTGGKKPYSKKLAATIDMEAKQLIAEAYK